MNGQLKAGAGWAYDDPNITYDGLTDPVSGNPVYYDSSGQTVTFAAQSKNTVTMSAQAKS